MSSKSKTVAIDFDRETAHCSALDLVKAADLLHTEGYQDEAWPLIRLATTIMEGLLE